MFFIDFTSSSLRQLKKIIKKDRAVDRLMKRKFTALQMINFKKAIEIGQIKCVEGISDKILDSLAKEKYDSFVYEYRNFPKQYPYRVYFIKKDKVLIILRILHHQKIKNKLAKQLVDSIKENILKK